MNSLPIQEQVSETPAEIIERDPYASMLSEYGDILTTQEVAEILQISEQNVRAEMQAGTIPAFKFRHLWRVLKIEFIEYLKGASKQNENPLKGASSTHEGGF